MTHLPNLSGYHSQRLEIIQTCLTSMRNNAGMDHTLMVWDNGSCDKLRDWLRYEFKPDVLVLSENVGKNTARTTLMRMALPDAIVGFSDDDIYHYPSWLRPQVELLQEFPNVACVTGYPVRTSFRWGNERTKAWAHEHAQMETGKFLPQQWEDDFAVSIGRDIQAHRDMTVNDNDVRITYKGRQAYATSHHCQFVGFAKTLTRIQTYTRAAMASDRPFDEALNELGLRLATTQRYTRHIGNVLHDELRKEINTAELIAAKE